MEASDVSLGSLVIGLRVCGESWEDEMGSSLGWLGDRLEGGRVEAGVQVQGMFANM